MADSPFFSFKKCFERVQSDWGLNYNPRCQQCEHQTFVFASGVLDEEFYLTANHVNIIITCRLGSIVG